VTGCATRSTREGDSHDGRNFSTTLVRESTFLLNVTLVSFGRATHDSYREYRMVNVNERVADRKGSQTVDRALHLVDTLAAHNTAMRLTDLSEESGLNISTTARLLDSLVRYGYVRRDILTGRYRLGYKFLHFANVVREQSSLDEIAGDVLEELAIASGETAMLGILVGNQVMVVIKRSAMEGVPTNVIVGSMRDLHSTAIGKAVLAFMAVEESERIASLGLPEMTRHTLTSPSELAAELEGIRQKGYALSVGEWDEDWFGIAAPVFHATGIAIAACGIIGSVLRVRHGDIDIDATAQQVIAAADRVTNTIGGYAVRPRVPARTASQDLLRMLRGSPLQPRVPSIRE
jgi:DNA-binding IclR family transcriptional regulator